jgi:hypothetical protein
VGSNGIATIFLTLSHAVTSDVTVNWATANGTATAGADYVAASGTATFTAGTKTVAINITLLGDAVLEADEWFNVILSNPVGAAIGRSTGIVTIANDDSAPSVSVAANDAAGSEQNRDPLSFVVTRSANLVGDIVVNLSWTGTASLTSDYTLTATGGVLSANGLTLAMAAGIASATITATPVDDTALESTENVTLNLLTGQGYVTGGTASGTGSITDNDTPAVVTMTLTDGQGAEQGSDPMVFTIARTVNLVTQIVVNLSWTGGAALASDYTLIATGGVLSANGLTLTLAPGVATATITATPIDDTAVESAETVTLGLLTGSGYSIGGATSATGSITDNDVAAVVTVAATDVQGAEQATDPNRVHHRAHCKHQLSNHHQSLLERWRNARGGLHGGGQRRHSFPERIAADARSRRGVCNHNGHSNKRYRCRAQRNGRARVVFRKRLHAGHTLITERNHSG